MENIKGKVNGNTEFSSGEIVVITEDRVVNIKGNKVLHKVTNMYSNDKSAIYYLNSDYLELNKVWDSDTKFTCKGFGEDKINLNDKVTKVIKEEVEFELQELLNYIEDEEIKNYEFYGKDNDSVLTVNEGLIDVESYYLGNVFEVEVELKYNLKEKEFSKLVVFRDSGELRIEEYDKVKLEDVLNKEGKEVKVYYNLGKDTVRIY